jgi:signal transduction histidine kinase/CheY-like chemotaxis protein
MMSIDNEEKQLHTSALNNAQSTLPARQRAENELVCAKEGPHKQNERLKLLNEAVGKLLAADSTEAIPTGLFDRIRDHLGADAYFNFKTNDGRSGLTFVSCGGISEEAARSIAAFEFDHGIRSQAGAEVTQVASADMQASDDSKTQLLKSLGIRAYAWSVLRMGHRIVGNLAFASRTRDLFEQDELDFIGTLSHCLAAASERIRLRHQLREADRSKDEFLAMLAHELRNPLAPIRNSLHILRLCGGSGPAAEGMHEMMDRQVKHMVRLVDDLMELSRIRRGKIELHKERIELTPMVHSAVESSRPLIEKARHELVLALAPEPLMLVADPVRMAQVIANLLNNAAKYTADGGRIVLSTRSENGEAVVSVRDNGLGIAADVLDRVFDMFAQLDRTRNQAQSGLGIGLTLVKSLVQMHGGRVEAKSEGAGRGSEFILHIPLADRSRGENSVAEDQPQTELPLSGRVLVVDDNRDVANSLAMLLKMLGADAHVFYDGPSALEAIPIYQPAVVLMDIGMPGMDGLEVARRVRQDLEMPNVVLVAMTGWGQDEDRRRSQQAGFDHHLVKPVDGNTLEKLLISVRPREVEGTRKR